MACLSTIPSLVLIGPTASGKTDVAHHITRQCSLDIISADAMIVCGMDIGTAKPTRDEQGSIPYLGLDLAAHDQTFSVFDYLAAVERRITMEQSGKQWMVAGAPVCMCAASSRGWMMILEAILRVRSEAETILRENGFEGLKSWCRLRLPGLEDQLPVGDLANPRR